MATEGTPFAGLEYAGARIYGSHLSLILYSNTADSLGDASVYANLTQPTSANGYAPITLNGTWTFNDENVTYVHGILGNPKWTATGTWSATATGVAVVDIAGTTLLHFKDLTTPFTAATGRVLEIDLATILG